MGDTSIEWTDATWNPTRGCSRVDDDGCKNCYAMRFAHRFSAPGQPYEGLTILRPKTASRPGVDWSGKARLVPDQLDLPLRWRRPRKVFVDSMSDLFHESLSNEDIAAVFGVMAAARQHTFQVLTKRPQRALEFFRQAGIAGRVDLFRHLALAGRLDEYFAEERTEPILGWPGYWITSKGRVLSDHKGERREMKPMTGEQGHSRVMLYREGETARPLIHRLVLSVFDDVEPDEQGCHIDGDPTNNALWNLRAGSQAVNWQDSKRHGTRRRYSKLSQEQVDEIRRLGADGVSGAEIGRRFGISDTQARNILSGRQWGPEYEPEWPLKNCWLGVSVSNQKNADERIPLLLQCPAAIRFVSYEPALGPVDFEPWLGGSTRIHLCASIEGMLRNKAFDDFKDEAGRTLPREAVKLQLEHLRSSGVKVLRVGAECDDFDDQNGCRGHRRPGLDWVIVGGESGNGARPMDEAWARSARDQCATAGVAFFYKQKLEGKRKVGLPLLDGRQFAEFPNAQ
jgi:protein gp37